jgi:hypothetical protein
MSEQQLLLDLGLEPVPGAGDAPPARPRPRRPPTTEVEPEPEPEETPGALGQRDLQRAALRWLEKTDSPTGMALNVFTRIARYRADVGAFWSRPRQNPGPGPTRVLAPYRTALVLCHTARESCWPACARSEEMLPELRRARDELAAVEARIREQEPHLRDSDVLFEELAIWHYHGTRDPEYHELRARIEALQDAVYQGTQFECIQRAQLADFLYLAVPEGVVRPGELAAGWGLLWVRPDFSLEVVADAEDQDCDESNRFHLVQNIAAASASAVLMAQGIRRLRDDTVRFVRPPRRRLKPEPGRVQD